MSEPKTFECRIISDDEDFSQLAASWRKLASQQSVFLSFEWFSAAWEWVRADAERSVVVIRRMNDIVGILPLVRRQCIQAGIPVIALEFLSIPDTQECDAIVGVGEKDAVAKQIVTCLQKDRAWHVLRLNRLPLNSFVCSVLRQELDSAGFRALETKVDKNLLFSLEGTWEEYYSRRSRRLKKGNNLVANRLAKNFSDIKIEVVQLGELDMADRQSVVEDVISVSSESWKAENTNTTFADKGPRSFLEKMCFDPDMSQNVCIWRLLLDGKCVATEIQVVKDGIVAALRSDFCADFQSDSPGTFLNREISQRLFEGTGLEYRMGPGSNTYKLRWSEKEIDLYELVAYSKTIRGRWLRFCQNSLKPLLASISSVWKLLGKRTHQEN